jgi:hypothetical protein
MIRISQNQNDSQVEQFINEQMNLRLELAQNPEFIQKCIEYAKSIGMSADEWNDNMFGILMLISNEVVSQFHKEEIIEK